MTRPRRAAGLLLGLLLLLPLLPLLLPAAPDEAWGPDTLERAVGQALDRTIGAQALIAQEVLPDARERTARATRATGAIDIDGRLDEADWARAEPTSGFTQVEPLEGQPAMEETRVRILDDDENLYIGARMYDSHPDRIARQLTRRGETGRAAGYFEFSLDPNFDRSTGYTFRVTAAGVQRDQYNYDDTSSEGSWDAVWE